MELLERSRSVTVLCDMFNMVLKQNVSFNVDNEIERCSRSEERWGTVFIDTSDYKV